MYYLILLLSVGCGDPTVSQATKPGPAPDDTSAAVDTATPVVTEPATWSPPTSGRLDPTTVLVTGVDPSGWVVPRVRFLPRDDDHDAIVVLAHIDHPDHPYGDDRALFLSGPLPRGDVVAEQVWDGLGSFTGTELLVQRQPSSWQYWLQGWLHEGAALQQEVTDHTVDEGAIASVGPHGYPYDSRVEWVKHAGFDADADGFDDILVDGYYTPPYLRYGPHVGNTNGGETRLDVQPLANPPGQLNFALPDHLGAGHDALVYGGVIYSWGGLDGGVEVHALVGGRSDRPRVIASFPYVQTIDVRPLHDIDGDGDVDVLLSMDEAEPIVVAAPLHDEPLEPMLRVEGGTLLASLGDIDGDGEAELLATGDDGLHRVLFSPHLDPLDASIGLEIVAARVHLADLHSAGSIAVGDIDGDGLGDIAYPEWPLGRDLPTGRILVYTGHDLASTWLAQQP